MFGASRLLPMRGEEGEGRKEGGGEEGGGGGRRGGRRGGGRRGELSGILLRDH